MDKKEVSCGSRKERTLRREILFRGQTRRYGEKVRLGSGEKLPSRWVYGGIFPGSGDFSIIYGGDEECALEKHVVYSDTVGQYTGRTDKNGVKIFEGDVVTGIFGSERIQGYVKYGKDAAFYIERDGLPGIGLNEAESWLTVIGNIHDNPELIISE